MRKYRERLEEVLDKLKDNKKVLAKCRRRAKKFRERAEAQDKFADESEWKYGNTRGTRRARRRAERSHNKAIYWKGRIKKQVARIHHLEKSKEVIKAEIAKYEKENKLVVLGGKVVGNAEPHRKLRLAIHTALLNYKKGTLPGYYSQTGAPRVYDRTLNRYPYGHIWDCSTFADGVYICCNLEAPSGPNTESAGGWTGTQGEHGRKIPESEAQTGDLVLYGSFPHHHVEVVDDPVRKTTVGHGSSPVDPGIFDLFGDGDYIIRRYV